MDCVQREDLLRRLERLENLERRYHRWRRTGLTAIGVAVLVLAFNAYGYSQRQNPGEKPPAAQKKVEDPVKPGEVQVDLAGMRTSYTNFFRVTGNTDEVVLDFGFYSQVTSKSGSEPVKLTDREVMNYYTAKKLLGVLKTVVERHEEAFGEIELDPNKRLRPKGKID